jgi:hypothetical protein
MKVQIALILKAVVVWDRAYPKRGKQTDEAASRNNEWGWMSVGKKRNITKGRKRDRKGERRTEITHRVREADSKRFKRYGLEMVGLNHGEDPYPGFAGAGRA